jgi:hypothetical protein
MTSPNVRLPRRKIADPRNAKIAAEIESYLTALTPDALHEEIMKAVPELNSLPVRTRLVR